MENPWNRVNPAPAPGLHEWLLPIAAPAAGIIHRDLKPGTTLLTEDGRIKIPDFSLAKQ